MSEFSRPANSEEYHQNFQQLKPLMNATMAYQESARCLFCYDAPCVQACPTHIDIPLFIRQINTGLIEGAAKTIYDANYFGNACGKVCPTEVLCEGACVYNHQQAPPIEIGRLQSYATSHSIAHEVKHYRPGPANGKSVAIIGAGPAGISCACELRLLGYQVDVFEARSQPSGLALYGCAPYKITNQEAVREVAYLQKQLGFTLHFNHSIDSKEQLADLESRYHAVFLGIGLGQTRSLQIAGEELPGCIGATEFIEQIKLNPLEAKIGERVVVVGGGNTAMDAASESARMGAREVTLVYRRSRQSMGAYDFEYELAKAVGVRAVFNASPIEVADNERAMHIKFVRNEEKNGMLQPLADSEFAIRCDQVIWATGQSRRRAFLSLIEGLELDERSCIITQADTYQTTNPRYFASGDAVNGGAEVVNACAEAKAAARAIHRYLSS